MLFVSDFLGIDPTESEKKEHSTWKSTTHRLHIISLLFCSKRLKRFFLLDFFSACKCHIFSIDFLYRFNLAYALAVRKLSHARDGIFFCGGELGKQNYSTEYNHLKISDLGIKFT